MARKTTIAAFEAWIADEANVEDVLDRVAGGLTLQKCSRELNKPFTCLYEYFHRTPENQARYEAARKAWADSKMDEAMELADECPVDKDAVQKAKLQIETRQNQAKAYHRERWGDKVQVDKNVTVAADAGLVGFARDLLIKKKPLAAIAAPGRVIDAETPTASLPAPAVKESV